MSAIQRWDKLYKMFKRFRLETDSNNFKVSKMHFLKKKKPYFEEKLAKNRNEPKKLWKALKSLDLSLDKVRKTKISVKKDGTIQFEAMKNANTFKRLYSELVRGLQGKLPKAPSNLTSQATKKYYGKTSCNVSNDFE